MAGQYEDAFSPPRLQCWTVPRPPPKLPTPRPPTPFIADDRGHLLPNVPRSKESPWGTFLGTWAMPARIPPARLDRSARSPGAAERLQREQPRELRRARNGIRTRVTGKLQEPWHTEPSGKDQGGPSGGSPHAEPPKPADSAEGGPHPPNPSEGGPCPLNPPEQGPPLSPQPLFGGSLSPKSPWGGTLSPEPLWLGTLTPKIPPAPEPPRWLCCHCPLPWGQSPTPIPPVPPQGGLGPPKMGK